MSSSTFVLVALLIALPPSLLLLAVAFLSRRQKSSRHDLCLIDRPASVTSPLSPEGAVLVAGELWRARSRTGALIGCGRSNVRVVGARGHLLEVEPRQR